MVTFLVLFLNANAVQSMAVGTVDVC